MKNAGKKTIGRQKSERWFETIGWILVAAPWPELLVGSIAILIIALFDIPEDKTLAVFVVVGFVVVIFGTYAAVYFIARKVRQDLRSSGRSAEHPK